MGNCVGSSARVDASNASSGNFCHSFFLVTVNLLSLCLDVLQVVISENVLVYVISSFVMNDFWAVSLLRRN